MKKDLKNHHWRTEFYPAIYHTVIWIVDWPDNRLIACFKIIFSNFFSCCSLICESIVKKIKTEDFKKNCFIKMWLFFSLQPYWSVATGETLLGLWFQTLKWHLIKEYFKQTTVFLKFAHMLQVHRIVARLSHRCMSNIIF